MNKLNFNFLHMEAVLEARVEDGYIIIWQDYSYCIDGYINGMSFNFKNIKSIYEALDIANNWYDKYLKDKDNGKKKE